MKFLYTILILLFCFFSVPLAEAQVGIAGSPMRLEFTAAKGSTQTLNAIVSNPSTGQLQVSASIADWHRDSLGNIVTFPAAATVGSCASWVSIYPTTSFILNPGQRQDITVVLRTPDSMANRVSTCMLFFTQINPQKVSNDKGLSINAVARIGIQLYNTPPSLRLKEIELIHFNTIVSESGNKKMLQLTLKNRGEIVANGKINFEITNTASGEKIALPEVGIYTLPGAVRIVKVALPINLAKGNYIATALVDYGQSEELKIGELRFSYSGSK